MGLRAGCVSWLCRWTAPGVIERMSNRSVRLADIDRQTAITWLSISISNKFNIDLNSF
jgi:hypothetical protein